MCWTSDSFVTASDCLHGNLRWCDATVCCFLFLVLRKSTLLRITTWEQFFILFSILILISSRIYIHPYHTYHPYHHQLITLHLFISLHLHNHIILHLSLSVKWNPSRKTATGQDCSEASPKAQLVDIQKKFLEAKWFEITIWGISKLKRFFQPWWLSFQDPSRSKWCLLQTFKPSIRPHQALEAGSKQYREGFIMSDCGFSCFVIGRM